MVIGMAQDVQETRDLIRSMSQAGHGPTAIARTLNTRGFTNSQGRPFSTQRVHQIVADTTDGREVAREIRECRQGVDRALVRLKDTAKTDAKAAALHAAFLSEREDGKDIMAAFDAVVALA